MDRQTEPQVTMEQTREDLSSAKKRLSGQAETMSLKEYMVKHPYIALGAAFFSGALLGGSREARQDIAKAVAEVIGKEVVSMGKKEK